MKDDLFYMKIALKEAKKAKKNNEIPVGAVIVNEETGEILAKGKNEKEKKQIVTKHAEINAIEKASIKIGNWRLTKCVIYTTLKPCKMCLEVIKNAKIERIVYGTNQKSIIKQKISQKKIKDSKINDECSNILKDGFIEIRNTSKKIFPGK